VANDTSQSTAPWWQVAVVLLGLIGLLVGLFYAMGAGLRRFSGLDPTVGAALVAGSATVMVSVITVFAGRAYERRRTVEENLRSKKIEMYQNFLEFWFNMLHSSVAADSQQSPRQRGRQSIDPVAFLRKFTRETMIWSSDEFLKEWSLFYRKIAQLDTDEIPSSVMLFDFEEILLAIRKEFGHKNKGLQRGDLLGTFINDIDKYLGKTIPQGRQADVSSG